MLKTCIGQIFFLLAAWSVPAQVDLSKSKFGFYYIEGEDVVFEFDKRAYAAAQRGQDSLAADFADLGVLEVAVSGNFNNWSKEGWKMQRVDENRFRLRKKVEDLRGVPNWQFKFVINGSYWMPPDSLLKKTGALGWYDIKNENAPRPIVSDSGNVLFKLKGFGKAHQVILAGTFNGWDEQMLKMKRGADGWEIRLTLQPGVYEYKFIADGAWMHDPANPETQPNEHGTLNSVLFVNKTIRFELKGFKDAQRVVLAGTFNKWNEKALVMRRTENGWYAEVPLSGGKHLYKFIVDGQWMTDPANRRNETDSGGNVNSVLFVQ
jgi:Glycogen recognition site of AMP-activated protein kinase/Carbohydrate-binding module 48 (Isoamylase N-terminal domain)